MLIRHFKWPPKGLKCVDNWMNHKSDERKYFSRKLCTLTTNGMMEYFN